jgi:Tol biopolymer transport system component
VSPRFPAQVECHRPAADKTQVRDEQPPEAQLGAAAAAGEIREERMEEPMSLRHAWLLVLAAALAACSQRPAATPSEAAIATQVASTLAAFTPAAHGSTEVPPGEIPAEPARPGPTPVAPVGPPILRVAYTNGGNIWLVEGDAPPVQLTSSGSAESVRLSSDGEKVVFTRRLAPDGPAEIHVVNRDGSGESVLAAGNVWTDLYPTDLLYNDVNELAFVPGTHRLLLNTRGIPEGVGLLNYDDLLRLDADTGALTTLLAPGSGGDFWISPDGQKVALTGPNSISLITIDGAMVRGDAITFPSVSTYSEYAYYPKGQWTPDSSAVGFAIPSADPLAPDPSGAVWRLPADGGPAVNLGTIAGGFFFTQGSLSVVSPDLDWVAFLRETGTPNVRDLFLAHPDGSSETLYAAGGISWSGWAPDAEHFTFGLDAPTNLQVGAPGSPAAPLATGTKLRWANATMYVYLSGSSGAWTLMRGSIGGPSVALASPAGEFVAFDLVYR